WMAQGGGERREIDPDGGSLPGSIRCQSAGWVESVGVLQCSGLTEIGARQFEYHRAQQQQGQQVGNGHHGVERIGDQPDTAEVNHWQRAQWYSNDPDDA